MTTVNENARLELLRMLAEYRERALPILQQHRPGIDHTFPPLGAGYLNPADACGPGVADGYRLFHNPWDDIVLAAREAAALGQIELRGRDAASPSPFFGDPAGWWGVRITDAGLDYIRARDAVGEVSQEAS